MKLEHLVWKGFTWSDDEISARYQVVESAGSTAMKESLQELNHILF